VKTRNKPPMLYWGDITDWEQLKLFLTYESLPTIFTLMEEVYGRVFSGPIKVFFTL
jgi:hypothetical protein